MFGGTSTWGQNNQNQQQQQQGAGGIFGGGGGGGGFGQQNTGGFGQSTSTFGQPAQQNAGGGGFGGGATNTGGFGAFGGNQQQQTSSFGARPAFGATGSSTFGQPANSGGGLFGNNNANTGGFGANNNTGGSLFGAKPAGTSSFGTGATSNLFGAKPANAFGGGNLGQDVLKPSNELQTYAYNAPLAPPPQQGTLTPAYYPTWQADPSTATTSVKDTPTHLFHSITAMLPYRGCSWEELRAVDYQQGRKEPTAQQQPSVFGASSGGFGQPAATGFGQQPAATGFGQQPAATGFGAPKPAGGLFGTTTPATTGFGASTGAFGQNNTNTGGSVFGQNQQQNTASPFGQANNNTGGSIFGQSQPQQNTGGLFGSNNANPSPFGSAQNQQQPAAGTSSFGAFGQQKPAFGATGTTGFGTGSTGTTGFGQQPAQGTTGFGGFGQNQGQQQQPAAGGSLFGSGGAFGAAAAQPQQNTGTGLFGQTNQQQQQPAAGGFGAAKPGGLFGSTTTPAAGGTGFGGFGQAAAPAQPAGTGLFGSTNNSTANTGGGLFGQTQPQQNAQQPAQTGGGLFGNTGTGAAGGGLFGAKPAAPAGGGLFGSTQPAQQPGQTGSVFGNTGAAAGGGLFGSTNSNAQPQQQTGGLFGAKPAGTGLFGATGGASTGTGLFGQQSQQQPQQQPQAGTGGLFGSLGQSQPASTGLFGSTAAQPQQQSTLGGGLFGSLGQSTAQQPQQQSLTASLDQNPYGNNPLFAFNGQKLEFGSQNKKPALPPLAASSYRLTPTTKSKVGKLRGFGTPLSVSQSPARTGSPLSTSGILNSPAAPDRYKGLTDTALTPNAFVPRPNIKKLSVTPKVGGGIGSSDQLDSVLGKSALRGSTGSVGPSASSPAPLLFNPPANGNGNSARQQAEVGSPLQRPSSVAPPAPVAGSEKAPKVGEYWCKPKLEKLRALPRHELQSLRGLTVGRRGYGEVTFLEPVDLSLYPLDDLFGRLILVEQSELSVYPEDYPNKAQPGEGLNVPARIMLENVFATDKATKEWVRDPSDARFIKFVKRVKAIPDTEFVSYTDDGTWTFKVEHFTTYGIADSDEEVDGEGESEMTSSRGKAIRRDFEGSSSGSPEDDDEDEDMLPPTKSYHDIEQGGHDSGLEEDETFEDSLMEDEDEEGTEMDDDSAEMIPAEPAWDAPLKSKLGAEGMRNLREMQGSFFGSTPQAPRSTARELLMSKKRGVENALGSFFHEAEEDNVMLDERAIKRTSFGNTQLSLPQLRQPRKYAKVALEGSVVKGGEGVGVDAGLALGRSFRCSWGPNGELVHFGKIGAPSDSFTPQAKAAVFVEKVEILADETKVETSHSHRLLSLHLENTFVDTSNGVPSATINSDIRFHNFAACFDAGDRSHEASVFRLGVALFDEIDTGLPFDSPKELAQRILSIRRRLALSQWLEEAVAASVDSDLIARGEDKPGKVFALLSGHQVERAVETALAGGDMRLATLVSQAGGPHRFKDELFKQLEDWVLYKANPLIAAGYRRLYALLAGITDVVAGDVSRGPDGCPDVLIAEGLDWKRALGLYLWYGNAFDNPISVVVEAYTEALHSAHPPARPLPAYLEKPADSLRKWNAPTEPTDVLYNLLRLYSDDTVSLDEALRSRDTSASPYDVRLAWHLYVLLAQVLKKRDFGDREETGYSACADQLTEGYAAQLEGLGEWKWAAFVMLHLQTVDGREKALRALIGRHPEASAEDESFLTDALSVPVEWIHESRAAALASTGDAWGEYHALLDAKLYDRAHKVLVDRLAPEAVVRDDKDLLRRLCKGLEGKGASGWEFGGKLFLEWSDLTENTTIGSLMNVIAAGNHPDPIEAANVNDRAQTLPRVLQLLPALFLNKTDVQQVAGLSEMLSPLYEMASALYSAGYIPKQTVSASLVDEDRLHLLQESAHEAFSRSLDALPLAA
ncbi:hypothetical protein IAT38_000161 [Cryptococcus sp. DSM 104549]